MSDNWFYSVVTVAIVAGILGIATLIYRHSIEAEQTARACIAAGSDMILGGCIRRAK